MDGQSLDARGLEPGCHLEVVPACEVPAQPDFDGDRNRKRLDDGRRHPTGSVRIAKQRRTARGLDDLRYRAAHVDVDDVRPGVGNHPGRFRHDVRVPTHQLDGNRPVIPSEVHEAERLAVAPHQGLAADHFGAGEARTELARDLAEGCVGHARHGGDVDGRAQLVGTDLHGATSLSQRVPPTTLVRHSFGRSTAGLPASGAGRRPQSPASRRRSARRTLRWR